MSSYNSFDDLFKDLENDNEYLTEKTILEFTIQLSRLMEKREFSKKELAEAIGSSQAYITKVFKGNANFTIATMTKLANALNGEIYLEVKGKEERNYNWIKTHKKSQSRLISTMVGFEDKSDDFFEQLTKAA